MDGQWSDIWCTLRLQRFARASAFKRLSKASRSLKGRAVADVAHRVMGVVVSRLLGLTVRLVSGMELVIVL